ncbi:uncharacterized protein [Physcomitrium patens]|uniref:uncharacterized protein isoform X3 n=1 Tax=Physcomitrium patens TaxID=3218 RepID=UPI000D1577EC|nr:RNA-binding protein 41-like isoform X3 [Physcomitrium patens]|eukprot:XP_024365077.1 RNA-binding protein 41-like isoform X3 [Physcomitrella patens]
MADSQEGGPPLNSQAEATLQQLLDRQLSTTGRLELVDFKEATESMRCIGHASGGVASLTEFQEHAEKQRQADEKAWALRDLLQSKGLSDSEIKNHIQKIGGAEASSSPVGASDKSISKRKRYGAHPRYMQGEEAEQQQLMDLCQVSDSGAEKSHQKHGHVPGPSSFISRRTNAVSGEPMIMGGRKALFNLDRGELFKGTTPQERARLSEEDGPRSVNDVFANPAPPVLDMYTYLEQRRQGSFLLNVGPSLLEGSEPLASDCLPQHDSEGETGRSGATATTVTEVPEEVIKANRMPEGEIRGLPGGKFANYTSGSPTNTVYIKNLAADVTEPDLIGIFGRFETYGRPKLIYRLMQRGRMKGQAFVTFAEPMVDSSSQTWKLQRRP